MTNVLVIGKGGREHALVWRLKQSARAGKVFCAPGNAGTAAEGATNLAIDHTETDRLARFCAKEQIGLVVIGPEDPLAAGLADYLRAQGVRCSGRRRKRPGSRGAGVLKELMRHADVPTAEFRCLTTPITRGLHRDPRLSGGGEGRRTRGGRAWWFARKRPTRCRPSGEL